MNEQQKETLSALLDGEASEFELRRLLAEGDVEIAAQWRRYQLIRDVGGSSHAGRQWLSAMPNSIAAQLEGEEIAPAPVAEHRAQTNKNEWLRPLAGFAVAASVAFVAVLGAFQWQQSPEETAPGFVADGNVSNSQLPMNASSGLSNVSGSSKVAVSSLAHRWQATWVPDGFAQDASGSGVRQLYSNGQATFSVFVENSNGMPVAETTRAIGATTVASRTIALHGRSYQVTVVGAIPEATARQVAASVRPLP